MAYAITADHTVSALHEHLHCRHSSGRLIIGRRQISAVGYIEQGIGLCMYCPSNLENRSVACTAERSDE